MKMTKKEIPVRLEMRAEAVKERIRHFREFVKPLTEKEAVQQSQRCLHCGTPYCAAQCPLHNRPVDFNQWVKDGRWHAAWDALTATNPFPEFTSRLCPALCESGCTEYLLEGAAVGIRSVERVITERAWKSGWVTPMRPLSKTGKRVAVVGSGPAGLACAQHLVRLGHDVTVFEKTPKAGGLLRYGIPDFKLEKALIDRRLEQLQAEGVILKTSVAVGVKTFEPGIYSGATEFVDASDLRQGFDAVVLAAGVETPRDWDLPGRQAQGIHFALELLIGQNRVTAGEAVGTEISCRGCDVLVLGGGDTGSDCIGVARRQGAGRIVQVARSPEPPEIDEGRKSWPKPAAVRHTSTSQEEGCERLWGLVAKEFLTDEKGAVRGVRFARLKWTPDAATGRMKAEETTEAPVEIAAQKVFLAIGFSRPTSGLADAFGLRTDERGYVVTKPNGIGDFCAAEGIFVCGDMRRGPALVASALYDGKRCAEVVNAFLMT